MTRTESLQRLLHQPVGVTGRILLLVAIATGVLALVLPLWTLSFRSNQYPDPLRMAIYADHLEGQKSPERDDLSEINTLNHYIGMRPLAQRDFAEFLWMPFVVGFFALFALRTAVLGMLRDVVDMLVLYVYFASFAAWSFYHRLWEYGHVLAPDAPIKVQGFMPPMFGTKPIANFTVASFPAAGSWALIAFGALLAVVFALTLRQAWRGRHAADTTLAAAA